MSARRAKTRTGLDYALLTPCERLSLTLRALARGDDREVQRLITSAPRKTYTAWDLDDTWHQVWHVAYNFRDSFWMLRDGYELSAQQVLGAARHVLGDDDYERVVEHWNETKTVFCKMTRDDLKRDADEAAPAIKLGRDVDELIDEYSKTILAHHNYHSTRGLLVAGLRAYAQHVGLSVQEVFAPLPSGHRTELLGTIEALPKWIEVPGDLARKSAEALAGARLFESYE